MLIFSDVWMDRIICTKEKRRGETGEYLALQYACGLVSVEYRHCVTLTVTDNCC